MPGASEVRRSVEEFFARHAVGRMAEDAFPAWWLHREFELAPIDAIAQCSTGSADHGLDAFHFDKNEHGATLHLIQSKLSASKELIGSGVRGFGTTLQRLGQLLKPDSPRDWTAENSIWTKLHARLQARQDLDALRIHCRVLHLSEADSESLLTSIRSEREAFADDAANALPDHVVHLSFVSPREMDRPSIVSAPSQTRRLWFHGVEQPGTSSAKFFIGIARLSELVDIYREVGDSLFAKNVRLYNYRSAERGPVRYLRETLREICVVDPAKRQPSAHFTMFHNGITVHALKASVVDGNLEVRGLSVLNGCQTVKSSWIFREEKRLRDRIDATAWSSIMIPLRVITSPDEDLVRRITVSNNRQTEIRPSAFRANDPIQLRLSERMRSLGIFYERQESAFENFRHENPRILSEDYPNSFDAPLKMEDLAQAIAIASLRPAVSAAAKISHLFEDPAYSTTFAENKLANCQLLVFLRNVLANLHLALKDARSSSGAKFEEMAPSRFRYPVARALMRWIVLNKPDLVGDYGVRVIARPSANDPFREQLRKLLSGHHSNILPLLVEVWRDRATGAWQSAQDQKLIDEFLRRLRLSDYDIFSEFAEAVA